MRRRRDNRLIEKRNAKIAARYYYWTEVQRLRSDDAIRQLSEEEFFLSEYTILQILRDQRRTTGELREASRLKGPTGKTPRVTLEMLARLITLMPDTLEQK